MNHEDLRNHCLQCGGIFHVSGEPSAEKTLKTKCPECGAFEMELCRLDDPLPLARTCKGCAGLVPLTRLCRDRRARYCGPCREKLEIGLPLDKTAVDPCPLCGAPMVVRGGTSGPADRFHLGCSKAGLTGCRGRINDYWRRPRGPWDFTLLPVMV